MPNIVLKRFMIFNLSEGQDEGRERDKLLYHWVKDAPNNKVDLTEQIDDVCLCDASITTSIRLNTSIYDKEISRAPTQLEADEETKQLPSPNLKLRKRSLVLTFDTTLVVIVEVEPKLSIWVGAHIGIVTESTVQSQDSQQQQGSGGQLLDPSSISSAPIERIISNIYARFCFLHGTFQMITDEIIRNIQERKDDSTNRETIRNELRAICDEYYTTVLSEIHMNSIMTNIPSLYNFIVYLDLNLATLMKVNSFVNHLVCLDAIQIHHTIAIFNDQLLWSSMNMYDSRIVYNYLVSVLIRDALQEELTKEMDKVRRIRENMPIYLSDNADEFNNLEDSISASEAKQNSDERELFKFYFTVFRSSNNMTLGLIIKDVDQFDLINKCEHILTSDSRLGVIPLASLAQAVGQNFLKMTTLSTSSGVASIAANKKRLSSNSSSGRGQSTLDKKYLSFDRLNVSASWSPNMELSASQTSKEQLLMNSISDLGVTAEHNKKNRKLRLTKYLLELEPELEALKQQSRDKKGVTEFLAKTTSDTWLTVMNSKYRSIYSIYKMRNVGLSEAQQYANDLSSSIASSRLVRKIIND